MVRYGVSVTAHLENLTDLQPAGVATFELQCGNCGELAKKALTVCFDQDRTPERKPHVIKKVCHLCDKVGSVMTLSGIVPITEEVPFMVIMELECKDCEPVSFLFGKGWKAVNPATGMIFNIDLSDGEFSDYDINGRCPVAVLESRETIKVLPPTSKTSKDKMDFISD